MAHGILRTARHGVVHGLKHGSLTLDTGVNPLASVDRDSSSLIYVPSTAAQWNTAWTVAGQATGAPLSGYMCQEAAGNLLDTFSTNNLTLTGAGHLFQQAVAGWTRKAVGTTDATAGQKWLNSTTSPNPSLASTMVLAYLRLPVASPVAVRDLFMKAGNADCRFNSTGKLRAVFGASADLVNVSTNSVRPVILQVDLTNSTSKIYTDQEKFSGTFVLPTSGNILSLGGQSAVPADALCLAMWEFTGVAAERSDAAVKAILQTLGWTIPWS